MPFKMVTTVPIGTDMWHSQHTLRFTNAQPFLPRAINRSSKAWRWARRASDVLTALATMTTRPVRAATFR